MPDTEDQHDQLISQDVECLENTSGGLTIELPKGFRRRGDVGDAIRHGSESELGDQILMGDALGLFTRGRRRTDVGLIFQRLECAIVELRGHDDRATTSAARGDLDGLALCCGDEIGLAAAEVGERHGSHVLMVHLVQDGVMVTCRGRSARRRDRDVEDLRIPPGNQPSGEACRRSSRTAQHSNEPAVACVLRLERWRCGRCRTPPLSLRPI